MHNPYSMSFLEHFAMPQNVGTLDIRDKNVEIGVGGGLESGKIIQISLRIVPPQMIEEAKFKAQGCVATLVCGSWLTVALIGKSIEAAKNITGKHIAEALKLPPEKYHCAMLAEIALREALDDNTHRSSTHLR